MNVGTLTIPPRFIPLLPYFRTREDTSAGVSGGRTSALMHVLTLAVQPEHRYAPCFANTGKEHEGTLVFLRRLEVATNAKITWLEFVPPDVPGAPPRDSRVREVTFETACQAGEPFEAVLATLAAYRKTAKGLGPLAPNFQMRLCTAYGKIKVQRKWVTERLGEDYEHRVGLRADEPERVSRLAGGDRGGVTSSTPLAAAGITKADVLAFWKEQPFDLEIPEYLGNCTKCFLKDEADIAQSAYEDPSDLDWWLRIQDEYGSFRPGRTSMRTIFAEAAARMEVARPAVARGEAPEPPEGFDPYRWKLILRQERKRLKDGAKGISCACEAAQVDDDESFLTRFWRPDGA